MDAHANLALSQITTAPGFAGTTASVTAGHGTRFPAVPFNATIWPNNTTPTPTNAEIVRVTAMTGDNITAMTRAQEGTTAKALAATYLISAAVTNQVLTDIEEAVFDPGPHWVVASNAPAVLRRAVTLAGGRVCDGTADNVEINAALAIYKEVVLSEGEFFVAATLALGQGQTLRGQGQIATLIRSTAALAGNVIASTDVDHVTVRDLGISGSAGGTNGISMTMVSDATFVTGSDANVVIDNVVIRNTLGAGVVMSGIFNRDSKLSKIHVYNSVGVGFLIDCPDGSMTQCIAGTNGSHGFNFTANASNWRVTNSKSWFSDGDGFWFQGSRCTVSNCESQDNLLAGFRLNCSQSTFVGCFADSNSFAPANANVGLHAGFEIGRTSAGAVSNGLDNVLTGCSSFDKTETGRGTFTSQRSGFRIRTGARRLTLTSFYTGNNSTAVNVAGSNRNVTAGVEWDTPSDANHPSNVYTDGTDHGSNLTPSSVKGALIQQRQQPIFFTDCFPVNAASANTTLYGQPFSHLPVGNGQVAPILSAQNNPGILEFRNSALINTGYAVTTAGTTAATNAGGIIVSASDYFECSFRITAALASRVVRMGLIQTFQAAAQTSGAYIEINNLTATGVSGNGALTTTAMGVIVANTWYRAVVELSSTNAVTFTIVNGVTGATLFTVTNLAATAPVGATCAIGAIGYSNAAVAAASLVQVDWIAFAKAGNNTGFALLR